jgi:hypothetical protein
VLLAAIALSVLGLLAISPAALANGVPLKNGEVLVSVGNGLVKHFDPSGTLLDTLNTTTGSSATTGMCTDTSGNLFVTDFSTLDISEFDPGGNLVAATWVSSYPGKNDESCTPDADNNVYVGGPGSYNNIIEYDPSGTKIGTFPVTVDSSGTFGVDWVDLAANQCDILYTDEGSLIKRFNVCTITQLPDFASGLPAPCYELRIRPNGEVMVACGSEGLRLDSSGTVLQTYTIPGTTQLFALNLDPDGTSFWTGDKGDSSGMIYHVDISTGAILGQFASSPTTAGVGGLYIVGGIVVSQTGLKLAPPTQTQKATVTNATVTAWLHVGATPVAGKQILFSVSGANSASGLATTDATGHATFSYPGTNLLGGTDTVTACYDYDNSGTCDSSEETATALVSWIGEKVIVRAVSVIATEGQPFSGATVATVSDPDTAATAGEYSALIEWGDGSTSSGTINGSGGSFTVTGSHTYAEEGTYTTKVTVTDTDNLANTASDSNKATVVDAILLPTGITPPGNSSEAYTVTATFFDVNPLATAADFTATIDWGDSTTSTGTVSGSGSLYSVTGSHFYTTTTGYFVKVKVVDDGGNTVDQQTAVQILGTPCLTKSIFRWHYSANGGFWSPGMSPDCTTGIVLFGPGLVPNASADPGTTVNVGYDFSLPANKATVTVVVGTPHFAVFNLRCLSTSTVTPLVVQLTSQAYSVTGNSWVPSANPNNPLTYQGTFTVPDVCGGEKVLLTDGAFFVRVSIF